MTSKAKLLSHWQTEADICKHARQSFDNYDQEALPTDDTRLLWFLIRKDHTTPLRHPQLSFQIDSALDVAAHLGKHHVGITISSKSYRYVAPNDFDTIELRLQAPDKKQGSLREVTNNTALQRAYEEHAKSSMLLYRNAIDAGVAAECARRILPQSTMTRYTMTGSLLAFINLVRQRCADDAQKETRDVANDIMLKLYDHYPRVMMLYGIKWQQEDKIRLIMDTIDCSGVHGMYKWMQNVEKKKESKND